MATRHLRDSVLTETAEALIHRRTEEGWRIAAIEWERESAEVVEDTQLEPVPFGFRIAKDCRHLEADPIELEILTVVTEMIIREQRLPPIAEVLNQKGYRTREGQRWTPATVFELMPRIVDSGPRIFAGPHWPAKMAARSSQP
jgi:hypothetical protein